MTKEKTDVLGISLDYATTKHAQTIGMLQRTHASLEKPYKRENVEEDQYGPSVSTLVSLITTSPTTNALG